MRRENLRQIFATLAVLLLPGILLVIQTTPQYHPLVCWSTSGDPDYCRLQLAYMVGQADGVPCRVITGIPPTPPNTLEYPTTFQSAPRIRSRTWLYWNQATSTVTLIRDGENLGVPVRFRTQPVELHLDSGDMTGNVAATLRAARNLARVSGISNSASQATWAASVRARLEAHLNTLDPWRETNVRVLFIIGGLMYAGVLIDLAFRAQPIWECYRMQEAKGRRANVRVPLLFCQLLWTLDPNTWLAARAVLWEKQRRLLRHKQRERNTARLWSDREAIAPPPTHTEPSAGRIPTKKRRADRQTMPATPNQTVSRCVNELAIRHDAFLAELKTLLPDDICPVHAGAIIVWGLVRPGRRRSYFDKSYRTVERVRQSVQCKLKDSYRSAQYEKAFTWLTRVGVIYNPKCKTNQPTVALHSRQTAGNEQGRPIILATVRFARSFPHS